MEVEICGVDDQELESVKRFDLEGKTYAIIRSPDGEYFAIDGFCTHEKSHLSDGWVTGDIVECSRHFGQFNYRNGEAVELPACINLRTYEIRVRNGKVFLNTSPR